MKKHCCRLTWYVSIILALTFSTFLRQATGLTEQPPAEVTPGSKSSSKKPEGLSKMFEGTVSEVIDAGRHIYVLVKTGENLIWIAVPEFDGKPGDKVLVPPGVPVAEFHSKTLNRVFKIIYFVGDIRKLDNNE